MGLARAAVTDQEEWVTGLAQAQVVSWPITAGLTEELASKENSSIRLSRAKLASWMRRAARRLSRSALGHHQLGEESEVGQLFAFGGGDLNEPVADGGSRSTRVPESMAATAAYSATPRRVDGLVSWPFEQVVIGVHRRQRPVVAGLTYEAAFGEADHPLP